MPLAALHRLVAAQETGVFRLHASSVWRVRIELVRGWTHAFTVESTGPDPGTREEHDAALKRAVEASLADAGGATRTDSPDHLGRLLVPLVRRQLAVERVDEPRRRAGSVLPFHPLPILRSAIATLLGPRSAMADRALESRAVSARMMIAQPLHASGLDPDEQSLATLLSTMRTWDELVARHRVPRVLRFLRDAVLLGSAIGLDDTATELRELLIEDPDARRRAYREQARALHPDLHPDDDDAQRRARTAAMAELAERHRR